MGYTVLEANAPGEALRAAGTHQAPIHLLLTDVIMPG
jgi:CheY-like chemotaxis protein